MIWNLKATKKNLGKNFLPLISKESCDFACLLSFHWHGISLKNEPLYEIDMFKRTFFNLYIIFLVTVTWKVNATVYMPLCGMNINVFIFNQQISLTES